MNPDWDKPENQINFKLLNSPLEELCDATLNRIRRQWPTRLGQAPNSVVFSFLLKRSLWVYRASRYLVADLPADPLRRPEFGATLPVLSRTILDAVFVVVFVIENYPGNLCWYLDSGYREALDQLNQYRERYPMWLEWADQIERSLAVFEESRDSACSEVKDPPNRWFPGLGKAIKDKLIQDPNRNTFLTYLNAWLYGELSSSAHSHWSGLVLSMGQILRMEHGDKWDLKLIQKYRSDFLLQEMTLLLCLVSEIIVFAGFEGKNKCAFLWTLLAEYSDEAKDIYQSRYSEMLA
ncbi:MAG: hypothetical protein JXA73_10835 [Acidobacteria bacterium]|nr:hypothetical protein [Acidobacteriota bacterium]